MNLRKAMAYGTAAVATAAVATAAALAGAVLIGDRMQYAVRTRPLERQVYRTKQEANELKAANAEMSRRLSGYTRFVVSHSTVEQKKRSNGKNRTDRIAVCLQKSDAGARHVHQNRQHRRAFKDRVPQGFQHIRLS